MDVHLIIVDFTKHQKGFSVQRCEAAVRASLTREFGRAVPFLFYAPPWVAQYLSSSQQVQLARGVPAVIQLMTDRIVRLAGTTRTARPASWSRRTTFMCAVPQGKPARPTAWPWVLSSSRVTLVTSFRTAPQLTA